MKPYQQRVVEEKEQLVEKLTKLNQFIEGTGLALPTVEQERLKRQRDIMQQYTGVLGERIAAFEP